MTTNAMSCESFNDRLMPYLEHEMDDATRAALERHALSCAECGALLTDLRKLRIDAVNLPELAPSRDLWSGIAARIEAPVVPIGPVRQAEQARRLLARPWTRVAVIAASLAAAAGLGYFAAGGPKTDVPGTRPIAQLPETLPSVVVAPPDSTPGTQARAPVGDGRIATPNSAPAAVTPRSIVAAQLAVATLTADYDREIARLRVLIDQRRNQLDPATVAIIEKNLQVIDTAIVECKRAIARDPASRFLIESLNQSLQTKMELMRTAALMPSRT